MNITALHRTMTALPLIATLALSGYGVAEGTGMGLEPGGPPTLVDTDIAEIGVSQFLANWPQPIGSGE